MGRKERRGMFKKLVNEFIDADIPVAEIQDIEKVIDAEPWSITSRINIAISRMDYKGLIKAVTIDNKVYLVNRLMIEEV